MLIIDPATVELLHRWIIGCTKTLTSHCVSGKITNRLMHDIVQSSATISHSRLIHVTRQLNDQYLHIPRSSILLTKPNQLWLNCAGETRRSIPSPARSPVLAGMQLSRVGTDSDATLTDESGVGQR